MVAAPLTIVTAVTSLARRGRSLRASALITSNSARETPLDASCAVELVKRLRVDAGDPAHHFDGGGVELRVGALPFATDFVDEVVFGSVRRAHGPILATDSHYFTSNLLVK